MKAIALIGFVMLSMWFGRDTDGMDTWIILATEKNYKLKDCKKISQKELYSYWKLRKCEVTRISNLRACNNDLFIENYYKRKDCLRQSSKLKLVIN